MLFSRFKFTDLKAVTKSQILMVIAEISCDYRKPPGPYTMLPLMIVVLACQNMPQPLEERLAELGAVVVHRKHSAAGEDDISEVYLHPSRMVSHGDPFSSSDPRSKNGLITLTDWERICNVDGLEVLSIFARRIEKVEVSKLRRLRNLRKLRFDYIDNVNIKENCLIGLDKLISLSMAGTGIHDKDVRQLGKLPKLQKLNLSDTRVTDACVGDLRVCSESLKRPASGDVPRTGIAGCSEL
jgi:hypothetical protein